MSRHAEALDLLEGWNAPGPDQEVLRRRYVKHLHARPDGMERRCRPDHLTASTLVLDATLSHALLTLHAKAHAWFQLGGHLEPGDATLAAAARREALEESGLATEQLWLDPVPVELSEHAVPFCRPEDASSSWRGDGVVVHHLDVRFVAVASEHAAPVLSEESLDLRWWPLEALPDGGDLEDLARHALARVQPLATMAQPPWSSGGGSTSAPADQPSR